jgi:hypothetical protein
LLDNIPSEVAIANILIFSTLSYQNFTNQINAGIDWCICWLNSLIHLNFKGELAMINKIIYFILLNCIFSAEPINHTSNSSARNEFLEDRAKGYLLNGVAKTAIGNNGNLITWDYHPAGHWREYGYLPHLGFVSGIPGHAYSSADDQSPFHSSSQDQSDE